MSCNCHCQYFLTAWGFVQSFGPSLSLYAPCSGASFANLFEVVNNFALFDAFAMLGADTLLYLFAAWYLDRVAPTEGQTPAHWLFCVRASFWCPDSCGSGGSGGNNASGGGADDSDADQITAAIVTASSARSAASASFIEPVAADIAARPGVHLRGLTKWFPGAAAPSVAHLDMACYEGQIFVLLGAGLVFLCLLAAC